MDKLVARLRLVAAAPRDDRSTDVFKSNCQCTQADEDDEVERLFLKWGGRSVAQPTPNNLPVFHHKLPREDDLLQLKLHQEARACLLQRRSDQLVDKEELKDLYVILDEHRTGPFSLCDEAMLGWDDFCAVATKVSANTRQYFSALVFAKLLHRQDRYGRISVMDFFNYVLRKAWLQRTCIGLSVYDTVGDGFLTDVDLEAYIREMIPTLPQLNTLDESLHIFYIQTAVRKFLFFLDPQGTNRISIQDILASGFLDELLEMREEKVSREQLDTNWFSVASTLNIYGQYLDLDTNHNGMLSRDELASYGSGTLTASFLDQLFQSSPTFHGEMDYKAYLDFVLAMDNRHTSQSLHYMFRVLDIDKVGYLNAFTLNYFFRDIQRMLEAYQHSVVNFGDIKDDIFDMVHPALPDRITCRDLVKCGQGARVVGILTDLKGFFSHDSGD